MSEGLTQRQERDRLHTIFHIYWDGLRVGRISKRLGNPPGTPAWDWAISVSGQIGGLSGTADSYEEARFAWKKRWPAFRDARSYDDWKAARETQEYNDKKDDVWHAKKLTSDPKVIEALTDVIGTKGPTPKWVLDMLDGKPPRPPDDT